MDKDELNVGDTICCDGYADTMETLHELQREGYLAIVDIGYTIRITGFIGGKTNE